MMTPLLALALLLAQAASSSDRVRLCDKAVPTRCVVVNADGSINISGSISVAGTADAVSTGAPTTFSANAVCTGALLLAGEQGAGFQLDSGGTLVGTLTPQYSLEAAGSNWTTTQFIDQNGSKTASIAATNPTSLTQLGIVAVTGTRRVQVCTTAYTSGTGTGFAVAAFVQGGAAAGGSSGLTDAQLRASPVPVTASSWPLPTGAATEATLAAIKAKTDNLDVALSTRTKPADTQAVSAVALPLPTGAATEATLAGVKTGTDKIPASPATDRSAAAGPFSTRLSDGAAFYKATTPSDTQPISAAALPLPAGASTEATLALIKTDVDKIPASPSTDRTAAASPFSVRISDGAAFLDPRQIRALTVADIVSAAQSGAWTVQPGNTANTTAWLVTGTGGVFPVTVAALPLPAGAALETTQAETHAGWGSAIPTKQQVVAGSDYGISCTGGWCVSIPHYDSSGTGYSAVTNMVRVQMAQPMNSLLQRCNAVRRTNCQP